VKSVKMPFFDSTNIELTNREFGKTGLSQSWILMPILGSKISLLGMSGGHDAQNPVP